MKKLPFLALLAFSGALLSAAELTLAENGVAKASIVIPENAKPIVRFAARELAEHLRKMTGAEFPVGSREDGGVNILLGFGDAENFAPDEYVIDARNNRISIYGKDTDRRVDLSDWFYDNPDKGTLRGVYNFLDSLGVRWLAPGDAGVYCPERRTLRIPEGGIRYKPHFRDRQIADAWNFMKYPDAKEYVRDARGLFLWGLRNNVSSRGMVPGCHSERTLGLAKNPERLAHPSALQLTKEGRRDPNYSCWSDPFTKEIWLRAAEGYFAGKTPKECGFDLKGYRHSKWPMPFISPDEFMIDPMDHSRNNDGRCRCERCEELRKRYPCADDTEIIWRLIADVAKEVDRKYPGRCISTLIYPPKTRIPQTVEKPKNVRVRICLRGARSLLYPERLKQDLALIRSWGEFLGPKNIPLWVYQCDASHGNYLPGVPDLYPRLTAEFIRTVRPLCAGMFCEDHHMTHTFRNLDLYIFMRLMWDPDRDVEKELDEYFRLYYGPAAAPAKELFTRLEDNWKRLDPIVYSAPGKQAALGVARKDGDLARKQVWSRVYDAAEMEKIRALMRKIEELAPKGTPFADRAGLLRKYLVRVMEEERDAVMAKEEKRQKIRIGVGKTSAVDFPQDAEWESVPAAELVSAHRFNTELKAPGSFRLLASGDTLFLRAELRDPAISASKTDGRHQSGNQELWKDNCIELFFHAEKSGKFWQIVINDHGAWSSQTKGRVLTRWEQMKYLRVTVRRRNDGWTADVAIPLRELKTDRSDLRFNITRERNVTKQPAEYSTWSPLATLGNWHSPDNYGTAVFE